METVFCIQNLILTNNPMKSQCRSRSRAMKSNLKNGFSPVEGRGKSGFESSSMHIFKVFSLMCGYFSFFHSNCLSSVIILHCSLLFFLLWLLQFIRLYYYLCKYDFVLANCVYFPQFLSFLNYINAMVLFLVKNLFYNFHIALIVKGTHICYFFKI